jgi:acetyltransferase-like isoleucine patch superfamily enzyme
LERQHDRVGVIDHVDLSLPDAHGFEQDVVLARGVHQQRRLKRRLGETAERAPGGHRADEDAGVEEVVGKPDPVAENGPLRERARGIDREDADVAVAAAKLGGQRRNQGALSDPRRAGEPDDPRLAGSREQLGHQRVALRLAVLDQADRPRQGPLVPREYARGEALAVGFRSCCHGGESRVPARVIQTLRFLARNRMLTPKYGRLLWRYAWRRLLTRAGRRWSTDGFLFLGRDLELQISHRGEIRFGRFVWIGDGTKIRCHEGEVEIGAKTVLGQDCTISAYRHVRIGEQCVIADRAMFIDFDHGVVDVERPIRKQGIYMRDVDIGSNVWIGYGACILRGVKVGDNAIVGTNSVVTKDVPANAVVGGVPAELIRMREAPRELRWRRPAEPRG